MERFDEFIERCLYDPVTGFYSQRGEAGGARGDFLTSPEVGPLFGAVIAAALDRRWSDLGRPDEFSFVEVAAGRGALVRSIIDARPACLGALRVVTVERSARLRSRQVELLCETPPPPDPDSGRPAPLSSLVGSSLVGSVRAGDLAVPIEIRADLPTDRVTGVVFANELLDNLAFRMIERSPDAWREVEVGPAPESGELLLSLGPIAEIDLGAVSVLPVDAPVGCRLPICEEAGAWVRRALELVDRGSVVVVDYGVRSTAELVGRDWLRTYRRHIRSVDPLAEPGSADITCDVAFDQLPPEAELTTQFEFLRRHGIDELVDEGRRIWQERAHLGDLAAIRARSRVTEAGALLDPNGLGGFIVAEWRR